MFFPHDAWVLIKSFWITLPNEYYWDSHEKISRKYHPIDDTKTFENYKFSSAPVIKPMVQIPDRDKPYFWSNSVVVSTGNPYMHTTTEESVICRNFATDIPIEYIQYIIVLFDNDVYSSTIRETFDCLYYIYDIPKKNKNGNTILPIYHSKMGIDTKRESGKKITIKLLLSENCPKPFKFKFEQTVQVAPTLQKLPCIFREIACHPISMYLGDTICYFIMESDKSIHELLLDNKEKLVLYKEKQFGRYSIYPVSNGLQDYSRMINFSKIKKVKLLTHFYEKGIYAIKK